MRLARAGLDDGVGVDGDERGSMRLAHGSAVHAGGQPVMAVGDGLGSLALIRCTAAISRRGQREGTGESAVLLCRGDRSV